MDRKFIKLRDNVLGDVSSRQYLKTPYLVFAVAILLTVGVTYFFYTNVETKEQARFANDVTKLHTIIENRLTTYIALLKSGRGFFEAGKEINKTTFARFVDSLELQENYPGVLGIGFIKRVRPAEKQALVQQMRAEGHIDFDIFPANIVAETEANVIIYLEPLTETNARAIGYAMSVEPLKLAAMEKAWRTGETAISEKIFLIQEPKNPSQGSKQPGFLMFVPIYTNGDIPASSEERKNRLAGFIYSPFRASNFVNDVQKVSSVSDISFAIYDQEMSEATLLAESPSTLPEQGNRSGPTQSLSELTNSNGQLEQINEINRGNEKWIVKYRTLPSFHTNSSSGWTLIIFFFGLGISLVLFFITLSQSKAHTSLELIANNLARSERVKDEFISVVSHELRTPLNSIAGGVTILRNSNVNEPTRAKALDIIDKNLRSQVNLVEDMIVFSDISTGKEYLQLKPLKFSLLVERAFNQFVQQAKVRNIIFEKHFDLAKQTVAGDQAKLEKVIQSILSNAMKFTTPGGRITMQARAVDSSVELKVRDTGFGIHPQMLPFVFDLFKQGDSSTIRRHGGLGLGMTLAFHIIKLHGGTLTAESEGVDKGSTFILTLPLIEGETASI